MPLTSRKSDDAVPQASSLLGADVVDQSSQRIAWLRDCIEVEDNQVVNLLRRPGGVTKRAHNRCRPLFADDLCKLETLDLGVVGSNPSGRATIFHKNCKELADVARRAHP